MQYTYTTERAVVTVRRPELTPEERAKRMAEIKEAAADLLRVQAQIQAAKATRATA